MPLTTKLWKYGAMEIFEMFNSAFYSSAHCLSCLSVSFIKCIFIGSGSHSTDKVEKKKCSPFPAELQELKIIMKTLKTEKGKHRSEERKTSEILKWRFVTRFTEQFLCRFLFRRKKQTNHNATFGIWLKKRISIFFQN